MASGSEIVTARGSSNDTAASAKSTLCFVRFAAALRGSHSNPSIVQCMYIRTQASSDSVLSSRQVLLRVRIGEPRAPGRGGQHAVKRGRNRSGGMNAARG